MSNSFTITGLIIMLTALIDVDAQTPVKSTQPADQPNILFIFADDQCYRTINALGNHEVKTPNLDRLVNRGMVFSHAYNMGAWNGAVCVASRAMLNTGRFVWRAQDALKTYEQSGLMWSQRLQKAGYDTYMAGKWHVSVKAERIFNQTGSVRPGMPNQTPEGYDRPKSPDDKNWLPWDRSKEGFWKGGTHWSEILANETVDFLRSAADSEKPFFIYAAFNAPHDPRQSPQRFVEMYPLDKISMPANFLPEYPYKDQIGCSAKLRDERLAPFPRTEYAVKVNRQEYYAIITHMDEQIGRILDALEKSGKADNTYIFFTADHGLACGEHGLMGKQNMYEHSLRPPFIVCGPDIKGNTRNPTPIYLQDLMATTLELAGADRSGVEFKSLCPLMSGVTQKHYDAIYSGYMSVQRAVIKDNLKLMHYPEAGVYRMFDLKSDPNEVKDLAQNPDYAQRLKEMQSELVKLQRKMDDPLLKNEQLTVPVAGRPLISYQSEPMSQPKGGAQFKGSNFLHPLKTPSGFTVTDLQPQDHLHHFGLWWPWKHIEIGGRQILCWELQQGDGVIETRSAELKNGGFNAHSVYVDRKAEGKPRVVLNEELTVEVSGIVKKPADGYFLDIEITHQPAINETITVTSYRYSGFSLRATPHWTKDNSSVITSEGVDYNKSNFTRARWVLVEGAAVEQQRAGLLLMSHPANFDHPEMLRTWNPKTHNGAIFVNFNTVYKKPWIFEPDRQYTRNYRVFVYDGKLTEEDAAELWQSYSLTKKD